MTELLAKPEIFYQPSEDELVCFAEEAGCCGDEVLTELAGGHHNAVYRYGDVVVRYPKSQDGRAFCAEFDFMQSLDSRRMPRAIARTFIEGTPVALIEYIDGEPKDFNDLTRTEVEELCRAMCDLHSVTSDQFSAVSGTPPSHEGTHGDYLLAMIDESVVNRLKKLELAKCDLSAYHEAREIVYTGLGKLTALLSDHPDEFSGRTFSLLHHDLNPGNVLWRSDESAVFIDLNPTYGDPLDDLNYAVTNNQGSPEFQKQLFKAYRSVSGCGEISSVRMEAYTLKNWLDDLAWTIEMREKNPGNPEYVAIYERRLTALRELL